MPASININFLSLSKKTLLCYKNNFSQLFFIATAFLIPLFLIDAMIFENVMLKIFIVSELSEKAYWFLNAIFLIIILVLFVLFIISLVNFIHSQESQEKSEIIDLLRSATLKYKGFSYVLLLYLIKTMAWAVLLVFPGILYGLLYSLSGMAYIIDGKKGNEALIYSKNIIRPWIIKYSDSLFLAVSVTAIILAAVVFFIDKAIYYLRTKQLYFYANVADYFEMIVIINAGVILIIFLYQIYFYLKFLKSVGR